MRLIVLLTAVTVVCYGEKQASISSLLNSELSNQNGTPVRLVHHVPFVSIKTGGQEWWFMLDTGANACAVSSEFVSQNFLIPSGRVEVFGSHNEKTNIPFVELPPFSIGSELFLHEKATVFDSTPLRVRYGIRCDGIIGFNLLGRFRMTLDYLSRRLHLVKTNSSLPSSIRRVNQGIPCTISNSLPYVSLAVQGRDIVFLVDTGYAGALAFPAVDAGFEFVSGPRSGGLGLSMGGEQLSVRGRLSGSVDIGLFRVEQPTVLVTPTSLLGGEILQNFILTIDPIKQIIDFDFKASNTFSPRSVRSLGVVFDRTVTPWKVLGADPMFSTELNGLRKGDLCTAVGGKSVTDLSWEAFSDLIGQTNVVDLQVSRGVSSVVVRVPVTIVVE